MRKVSRSCRLFYCQVYLLRRGNINKQGRALHLETEKKKKRKKAGLAYASLIKSKVTKGIEGK